jgi:hypothetical protein
MHRSGLRPAPTVPHLTCKGRLVSPLGIGWMESWTGPCPSNAITQSRRHPTQPFAFFLLLLPLADGSD